MKLPATATTSAVVAKAYKNSGTDSDEQHMSRVRTSSSGLEGIGPILVITRRHSRRWQVARDRPGVMAVG